MSLQKQRLGFSLESVDSEGKYVVRAITAALWYIHPHFSTISDAGKCRACVPPIPSIWLQVFGNKTYNDWQSKKQKRPHLDSSTLGAHARTLFALLDKPCITGKRWNSMRSDIEGLANTMRGYTEYLDSALKSQRERQSREQPVRQLSEHLTVTCREPVAMADLSGDELKINEWLVKAGEYEPVFFDELTILGKVLTKDQRYKLLKNVKISVPLNVLRYDPGGGSSVVTVLWRVPLKETDGDHATNIVQLIKQIEPQLPVFHTRQMRQEFYSKYGQLTGMTPAVMRAVYLELTGDATTRGSAEVDRRMQLYILGELPQISVDLRHMNSGRPEVYDAFYNVAAGVLQDWMAEDDRRHGVAHLSQFISIRDLHKSIVSKCPPGTSIPSEEWLRLQFLPVDPNAASAVHYTGRLEVKFAVQSRVLRADHEDSHYAAAVFRYQRDMAVDLQMTAPLFICMDDKAKIPYGEPGRPTSTNVRSRPSLVLKDCPLTAIDHDHTKGSLTPSVILRCTIPEKSSGSFYQGQADVRLKDSVFQRSSPFRHMAELSASVTLNGQPCPPVVFAYTDGGCDHRVTCRSVQLAYIAFFIHEDLDLLVAARTCPGHSFSNPAERVMSTLNLGLQNAAFARAAMPDRSEGQVKHLNSMSAIRAAAKRVPELEGDWLCSVQPVQEMISRRFNRLIYGGSQIRALDLEDDGDICKVIQHLWPDIDFLKLTAKDLASKEGFQQFLASHCQLRQYSFQVTRPSDLCSIVFYTFDIPLYI